MPYPTFVKIYAYLAGIGVNPVDITTYIVSDIMVEYGLPGSLLTNLVADIGTLSFLLDFSEGEMSGFNKGTKIKLQIKYNNDTWTKFYGTIDTIDRYNSNNYLDKTIRVTVVDWMDSAMKSSVNNVFPSLDKTEDEAATMIINNMIIQPKVRDFESGTVTFPTVFDIIEPNEKVISELNRLALSELAPIYLRKDKTYGETLVIEANDTRDSAVEITLPGDEEPFIFDNNMLNLVLSNGENIINKITLRAYPRNIGTDLSVLYSLPTKIVDEVTVVQSIYITMGETIILKSGYTFDKIPVNAINLAFPEVTTDYQMFANEDGTGTDYSENLDITPVTTSEGFSYSLYNKGASAWIYKLDVRGYYVMLLGDLVSIIKNDVSISNYDYKEIYINQKYQNEINSELAAKMVVLINQEKDPRIVPTRMFLLANESDSLMRAFLNMDIGDLTHIVEDSNYINGSYFIQRIGYTITTGGIINYWFDIKEKTLSSDVDYFWEIGSETLGKVGTMVIAGDVGEWWLKSGITGSQCIAAYAPRGASDLADSYINLANPGVYNINAPLGNPGWNASNGWIFDGTKYLQTGIVATNSYSAIIKFGGVYVGQYGSLFGVSATTQVRFNIYPNYGATAKSYFRSGGSFDQTTLYTNGILAVTPYAAYQNGSFISILTSAYTGTTTNTIPIGAIFIDGSAYYKLSCNIQAIAIYNITLTSTQILAITNAMNSF